MMRVLAVLLAVAMAFGCWFYWSKRKAASARAVSAAGVKMDLLSFARAERAYKAGHRRYASEPELYTSGAMKTPRPPRDGYTYSWGNSQTGFSIMARCQLELSVPCPSFSIDQGMQIEPLPQAPAAARSGSSDSQSGLLARLKSVLAKFDGN